MESTRMCDVVESAPTKTELPMLMEVLRGQVLRHSMDAHGCRLVQRALALADNVGRLESFKNCGVTFAMSLNPLTGTTYCKWSSNCRGRLPSLMCWAI